MLIASWMALRALLLGASPKRKRVQSSKVCNGGSVRSTSMAKERERKKKKKKEEKKRIVVKKIEKHGKGRRVSGGGKVGLQALTPAERKRHAQDTISLILRVVEGLFKENLGLADEKQRRKM